MNTEIVSVRLGRPDGVTNSKSAKVLAQRVGCGPLRFDKVKLNILMKRGSLFIPHHHYQVKETRLLPMIDSGYGLNRFAHFIKIKTTVQKRSITSL